MSQADSHHARDKSSSSYVNFSRPRLALSQRGSQSSLVTPDPSLIPAPLQIRRSEATLGPQAQGQPPAQPQAQVQPQGQKPTSFPAQWQSQVPSAAPNVARNSFESHATFGTVASNSSDDSAPVSNLSSNDHFNLFWDPENDDRSDTPEPWADGLANDAARNSSIRSDVFRLGGPPFPDPLHPQHAPPPPPPQQHPPPPPNASAGPSTAAWRAGDPWPPPRHPHRVLKRVSFDQLSEHLPPSDPDPPYPAPQPTDPASIPQVRATRSLEYNRQGSFSSFQPSTFASDASSTSTMRAAAAAAGSGGGADSSEQARAGLGDLGNLKRNWSSSNHDVSALDAKKLAKLKKKGINPALYVEMQEARRGKNGKRRWVNPLVGNTYIG